MDWNQDGKTDLIAGDEEGQVWLFLNVGERGEPVLAEGLRVTAGGEPIAGKRKRYRYEGDELVLDEVIPGSHELADIYSKIHMADWNGDGLRDLLVGHSHEVLFYRNSGRRAQPRFENPVLIEVGGEGFPTRPSPFVVDWDLDGTLDLLVGSESSEITFYRNEGTARDPKLAAGRMLELSGDRYHEGYRCRIDVIDWNEDGVLDLLVGNRYRHSDEEAGGHIWLFLGR